MNLAFYTILCIVNVNEIKSELIKGWEKRRNIYPNEPQYFSLSEESGDGVSFVIKNCTEFEGVEEENEIEVEMKIMQRFSNSSIIIEEGESEAWVSDIFEGRFVNSTDSSIIYDKVISIMYANYSIFIYGLFYPYELEKKILWNNSTEFTDIKDNLSDMCFTIQDPIELIYYCRHLTEKRCYSLRINKLYSKWLPMTEDLSWPLDMEQSRMVQEIHGAHILAIFKDCMLNITNCKSSRYIDIGNLNTLIDQFIPIPVPFSTFNISSNISISDAYIVNSTIYLGDLVNKAIYTLQYNMAFANVRLINTFNMYISNIDALTGNQNGQILYAAISFQNTTSYYKKLVSPIYELNYTNSKSPYIQRVFFKEKKASMKTEIVDKFTTELITSKNFIYGLLFRAKDGVEKPSGVTFIRVYSKQFPSNKAHYLDIEITTDTTTILQLKKIKLRTFDYDLDTIMVFTPKKISLYIVILPYLFIKAMDNPRYITRQVYCLSDGVQYYYKLSTIIYPLKLYGNPVRGVELRVQGKQEENYIITPGNQIFTNLQDKFIGYLESITIIQRFHIHTSTLKPIQDDPSTVLYKIKTLNNATSLEFITNVTNRPLIICKTGEIYNFIFLPVLNNSDESQRTCFQSNPIPDQGFSAFVHIQCQFRSFNIADHINNTTETGNEIENVPKITNYTQKSVDIYCDEEGCFYLRLVKNGINMFIISYSECADNLEPFTPRYISDNIPTQQLLHSLFVLKEREELWVLGQDPTYESKQTNKGVIHRFHIGIKKPIRVIQLEYIQSIDLPFLKSLVPIYTSSNKGNIYVQMATGNISTQLYYITKNLQKVKCIHDYKQEEILIQVTGSTDGSILGFMQSGRVKKFAESGPIDWSFTYPPLTNRNLANLDFATSLTNKLLYTQLHPIIFKINSTSHVFIILDSGVDVYNSIYAFKTFATGEDEKFFEVLELDNYYLAVGRTIIYQFKVIKDMIFISQTEYKNNLNKIEYVIYPNDVSTTSLTMKYALSNASFQINDYPSFPDVIDYNGAVNSTIILNSYFRGFNMSFDTLDREEYINITKQHIQKQYSPKITNLNHTGHTDFQVKIFGKALFIVDNLDIYYNIINSTELSFNGHLFFNIENKDNYYILDKYLFTLNRETDFPLYYVILCVQSKDTELISLIGIYLEFDEGYDKPPSQTKINHLNDTKRPLGFCPNSWDVQEIAENGNYHKLVFAFSLDAQFIIYIYDLFKGDLNYITEIITLDLPNVLPTFVDVSYSVNKPDLIYILSRDHIYILNASSQVELVNKISLSDIFKEKDDTPWMHDAAKHIKVYGSNDTNKDIIYVILHSTKIIKVTINFEGECRIEESIIFGRTGNHILLDFYTSENLLVFLSSTLESTDPKEQKLPSIQKGLILTFLFPISSAVHNILDGFEVFIPDIDTEKEEKAISFDVDPYYFEQAALVVIKDSRQECLFLKVALISYAGVKGNQYMKNTPLVINATNKFVNSSHQFSISWNNIYKPNLLTEILTFIAILVIIGAIPLYYACKHYTIRKIQREKEADLLFMHYA